MYERWLNHMWLEYSDLMDGAQSIQSIDLGNALESLAAGIGMESYLLPDTCKDV
jgi:hypothetical protein